MDIQPFALIGHPLGHTMSPFLHQRLFPLSGLSGEYRVLDVPPEELETRLPALWRLCGFNVTIPYKQAIVPFLSRLEGRAKLFHSVNVAARQNGEWVGYNTDSIGFSRALQAASIPLGGRVVVLGAGGAARALAFESALAGAQITIAAREHSLPAAQRLAEEIRQQVLHSQASASLLDQLEGDWDLLANATPVGMYPHTNASPVGQEVLCRCRVVFDAVYNPNETLLLKTARECGAAVVHGMDMLVWQAAAAQEIWSGKTLDPSMVAPICEEAVQEMQRLFGSQP